MKRTSLMPFAAVLACWCPCVTAITSLRNNHRLLRWNLNFNVFKTGFGVRAAPHFVLFWWISEQVNFTQTRLLWIFLRCWASEQNIVPLSIVFLHKNYSYSLQFCPNRFVFWDTFMAGFYGRSKFDILRWLLTRNSKPSKRKRSSTLWTTRSL